MVARELRSGRELRLWADDLRRLRVAPFAGRAGDAVRRLLRLGRVGLLPGARLAAAGAHPRPLRRVPGRDERARPAVRARAAGGARSTTGWTTWTPRRRTRCATWPCAAGPYSTAERAALIAYCAADVTALAELLPRMLPAILARQRDARRPRPCPAARAVHGRGRAHGADRHPDRCAGAGTHPGQLVGNQGGADPRGRRALRRLRRARASAPSASPRTSPRRASPGRGWRAGALALDDDTFREMARAYPRLQPLRELRHALGELRLSGWRSAPTAATASCSPPSPAAPAATSPATAGSSSARRPGCGA